MPVVQIGARTFKTKDAAKKEIRRILWDATLDAPLEGDKLQLITDLYNLHPRKEGEPIAFCVGENDFHGARTRGFHGLCADGSRIRFSYLPCLTPSADKPDLIRAMRAAIIPSQNEALKNAYRGRAFFPCHHCQKPVTRELAHVHHMYPKFRDISDAFVALVGAPPVVPALLGDEFADPRIMQRWIAFHDAVCQRVVLCAPCNAADERKADE